MLAVPDPARRRGVVYRLMHHQLLTIGTMPRQFTKHTWEQTPKARVGSIESRRKMKHTKPSALRSTQVGRVDAGEVIVSATSETRLTRVRSKPTRDACFSRTQARF